MPYSLVKVSVTDRCYV